MKKMNLKKLLCLTAAVLLLAGALVVPTGASSAYQTYTYSIGGTALYSPDAYTATKAVGASEMGLESLLPEDAAADSTLGKLNNPSDLVTDKAKNVYIADTGNNRILVLDRYYKLKRVINTFTNSEGVPDALAAPQGVHMVHVKTARDMFAAAEDAFEDADIAIFAAAVADMRPREAAGHKLKKGIADAELGTIDLVENPDILATLGERKEQQVVVGFAAETNDVVANAEKKLVSKHADLVVANEVGGGRAFGADDNVVWFVDDQDVEELPRMSKTRLADEILNKAMQFLA